MLLDGASRIVPRVHRKRYDRRPDRIETTDIALIVSELLTAVRSPVAPVKQQDRAPAGDIIWQRHLPAFDPSRGQLRKLLSVAQPDHISTTASPEQVHHPSLVVRSGRSPLRSRAGRYLRSPTDRRNLSTLQGLPPLGGVDQVRPGQGPWAGRRAARRFDRPGAAAGTRVGATRCCSGSTSPAPGHTAADPACDRTATMRLGPRPFKGRAALTSSAR